MKNMKTTFAALALLTLSACAGTPGKGDPRDPLESYNRAVYTFNDKLDQFVLKPVAKGYDNVLPTVAKTGVRNFFGNLGTVLTMANNALQGKGEDAFSDLGRFLLNSTFGVAGLFDIATPVGMPQHKEDFGQTLGKWGIGSGPYFVLPFLGPSTIRDAMAKPLDWQLQYPTHVSDIPVRNSLYALEVIDTRASLLGASNVLGEAALDPYVFVRDAYLQRRQRMVYDGNPPKTDNEFEDDESGDEENGGSATNKANDKNGK